MNYKLGVSFTKGEKIGGWIFLLFYAVLLGWIFAVIQAYAKARLDFIISDTFVLLLNYYVSFFAIIIIFKRFLKESLYYFVKNLWACIQAVVLAGFMYFVLTYIAGVLIYDYMGNVVNPNDAEVTKLMLQDSKAMIVCAIFLAPLIEEVLFRGLIFGSIHKKSRIIAHIANCLIFGIFHIWQFALSQMDWTVLLYALQYIPGSIALAWCYEKSGSIWSPVFLHMSFNAMTLFVL